MKTLEMEYEPGSPQAGANSGSLAHCCCRFQERHCSEYLAPRWSYKAISCYHHYHGQEVVFNSGLINHTQYDMSDHQLRMQAFPFPLPSKPELEVSTKRVKWYLSYL